MNRAQELETRYLSFVKLRSADLVEFPYPYHPDDAGGCHFEIASDGKVSFLSSDRGKDTEIISSYCLDEVLYEVFKIECIGFGMTEAARRRMENDHQPHFSDDRIVGFEIARREMKRIRADWYEALKLELDAILQRSPIEE